MKSVWTGALLAAGMLTTGVAVAADANMELAQKSGCLACHALDKKLVGPSYKEVAAKYKGDKAAEATLVQKVIKGGSGTWGQIPMPPNNVTEAQAQQLVKWILSM
ncbi:MAG: c-type cytochrome [Burkholderiales bacterium]